MRIGLIEVGSRAIRYDVSDWEGASFDRVDGATVVHGMHPGRPDEQSVLDINRHVEALLARAGNHDCDVLFAYGTAACRVVADRFPGLLAPSVKVLTPIIEATASWFGGFTVSSRAAGDICTVIDQGNGSTEIARAVWNGDMLENLSFHSVDMGSVALLEAYARDSKGHFSYSQKLIAAMLPALAQAGISTGDPGTIVLQGGAATSIGWLATTGTGMQNYQPAQLNGRAAGMDTLQTLYASLARDYRNNPVAAARRVDARPDGRDHVVRVLSSFPFLIVLASFLKPQGPFVFSGQGSRHGMAFLLHYGLIDTGQS